MVVNSDITKAHLMQPCYKEPSKEQKKELALVSLFQATSSFTPDQRIRRE